MPGMREIRRRIKSIKNTQQITRAMHMIAAAKIKKLKTQMENTRPYVKSTEEIIQTLVIKGSSDHSRRNKARNSALVVITGDRGLAGGYNIKICRKAQTFIENKNNKVELTIIGSKGIKYFDSTDFSISNSMKLGESISSEESRKVAETILNSYKKGDISEVYIAYTEFITTMKQEPRIIKILPYSERVDQQENEDETYIFEPSPEALIEWLLPQYINSRLLGAMLESKTSELASRMTAMDNATQNAQELIEELTLTYNRARQAMITEEISEIMGGAEAQTET